MIYVIDAKYLDDYKVWVKFNDQSEKVVNFKEKIFSDTRSIFKQLTDINFFKKVKFNAESDTIAWPNGLDIAPESLYNY